MPAFATIDYHVTSRCNQECPYCWGPQDFDDTEVDSKTAASIVRKIVQSGAQRIVFTGGDPILRPDIGMLIRLAKQEGLEVALSTTGDELTRSFVRGYGSWIDLISLPLDGASEEVSSRTKKEGHFSAIRNCLDFLVDFPAIDVKVATPVTLHNIHDIPGIIALLDERAAHMPNHLFYNIFQSYPRAMQPQSWEDLVVSDDDFQALKANIEGSPHAFNINWLDHETLDRLYVMVFPDGSLTIPSGSDYTNYGPFLEIKNLEEFLSSTDFDAPKHLQHSKGWSREHKE